MTLDLVFAPIITLFWRSFSLQSAILILLKSAHAEEGFALSRSLFDDALMLHELSVSGDGLCEYILEWNRHSVTEQEGLMKEARRLNFPGDHEAELTRLAGERRKLEEFASKRGITRGRRFLSPKDAAAKFGRNDDFWMYRLAEEMVHGSDAALSLRRQKKDDGSFNIESHVSAPWLIAGIAGFSARSLLQSLKATSIILKWDAEKRIEEIQIHVDAFDY